MSTPTSQNGQNPTVAIIGGGITGLSAAWYLQKVGISYIVIEKSDRLGGKIQTEIVDDATSGDSPFVIEQAADAFLAVQKPWATELAVELGLDDEILSTNQFERAVYIVYKGALKPLPAGLQLIIPTNPAALQASALLSEGGKQRMLEEASIPACPSDADESVADFVTRRMGHEALEAFAEPLLSGIYNADPAEQSLHATFPRFAQMERAHGSLTQAVEVAQQKRAESTDPSILPQNLRSAFISFRGGTETLIHALRRQLTGTIKTASAVTAIERESDGCYRLGLENDARENIDSISADHLLITAPAAGAAKLLSDLAPAAVHELTALRTVSTGIVHFAYRRADVAHPLDGFGVVIPRREGRPINAMTWTTSKFSQRAPQDHVLIRVFFGGVRTPQIMALDDAAVLATVRRELKELLGIEAAPFQHWIFRWWQAQPQYDVGHLERMKTIHSALPGNLYIAGSPYGGVGIPDCVRQGKEVAEKIYDF